MDVRLPDGTLLRNVPEGTTKAQLTEKLAANGYDIGKLAPVETTATRENVLPERAPAWAKDYPKLYEGLVTARQVAGPTVEAGGAIIGGGLGATAGTFGAGPVGTATGGVAGAGLGYGIAKEALEAADVYLGLKEPRKGAEIVTEPAKNILEGATYEAGGRVAAPIIAKGAGKAAEGVSNLLGKVADLRQIPTQKAAKIAREAIGGGELDDVLNALRNAKPGQTPAQALADAGINQPTAQALLQRASQRDPKFFTDLLKTQDFATVNKLSQLAGGETATASRNTLANMKDALNSMTGPQRDAALNRGNLGKAVAEYEAQAGKLSKEAAAKVQEVRDLINAGNKAEAWAKLQVIKQGLPVSTARYTYANELAEKAFGEWSDKAAQASLDLGQGAKFAGDAAGVLRRYGVKPLKGAELAQKIANIANNEAYAGNDILEASVKRVVDDINKWTGSGGVIDLKAMDAIRKNSVNAAVRDLLKGQLPTIQQEAAASAMAKIKPLIDDAIEAAGGKGYKQYLADHAAGMRKIDARKLTAEARRLYENSPDQFVKLVEGNSPKVVEEFMGKDNYDLALQLSQDVIETLKGASKQITTRQEIAKQATQGEQALVELMKDNVSTLKLPNVFNVAATTTNKALDILEKKVGKATMAKLTEAAKTAKGFDELLNTLPASERNAFLKAIKDPNMWVVDKSAIKEMGKKFTGAGALGANALARDQENQNALAK